MVNWKSDRPDVKRLNRCGPLQSFYEMVRYMWCQKLSIDRHSIGSRLDVFEQVEAVTI